MTRIFACAILTCLVASCGVDADLGQVNLKGTWEIAVAKRDGNLTKSLDMATMVFLDSTRMTSNLFTAEDTVTYNVSGTELHIAVDPPIDLTIRQHSGDTLVLKARLNAHRYDMMFLKGSK